MKTNFYCCILFLLWPLLSTAQTEWAPIGATWDYGAWFTNSSEINWYHYEVLGDTIVEGQACRFIEGRTTYGFSGSLQIDSIYTYAENDSIYILGQEYSDEFLLTYDFSLEVGDSLVVPDPAEPNFYIELVVESISQVDVNGQLLKKYYFNTNYGYYVEVMEGIGSLFAFTHSGSAPVTETKYGDFRCYDDGNLIYSEDPDCDFFGIFLDAVEDISTANIEVFPNPAQGQLNIKSDDSFGAFEYQIYDLHGRCLIMNETNGENLISVNVEKLNAGIYVLLLKNAEGRELQQRIIIH